MDNLELLGVNLGLCKECGEIHENSYKFSILLPEF